MKSIPPKQFSILIVDDEPKNIQLIANILKEENYEIEFALDGETALNWVQSKEFDLILLDVMMPDMDGYTVCQMIKKDLKVKHIPIIFLTAKTDTDDIVRGFEAGGSDYVTKPFKTKELLARIKIHVEMKTLRGFITICAQCKKVRLDEGSWKEVDSYIADHSEALFSHSICDDCANELYGKEDWYLNDLDNNKTEEES